MAVSTNGLVTNNGGSLWVGPKFNPASLFAASEQGAWYDPSAVVLNWRRNLLTYTEQFDNAAWQKNNTTVSSNATTAPDGTLTADKMIETVSGPVGHGVQFLSGFSYALGNVFTLSCYAKAAERSVVILRIDGVTTNFGNAVYFDLSTGTASQVAAGVTASIVSVGSGWYRVSATAAATASGSGGSIILVGDSPTGSAGGDFYAGDGISGIYIWGAQLEQASTATAYQQIVTPEITYVQTVQSQPQLFQNSTGATPVTAVEQAVGLILDRSKGLVLGPELVTNGDFSSGSTGWTLGASWSVSAGIASYNNAGAANAISQPISVTAGRAYLVTYNLTLTSGFVYPRFTGGVTVQGITRTSSGSFSEYVFAVSGNNTLGFVAQGVLSIDNISVKELPGNHAFQSTDASRPTLRARYNQLTNSQNFSGAGWTVDGISLTAAAGTAPDGTNTATSAVTGTGSNRVYQFDNSGILGNKIFSIYVKPNAGSSIAIQSVGGMTPGTTATINASTGVITGFSGASSVFVGDGWYRVFLPVNVSVASTNSTYWLITGPASSVFIWGAQLMTQGDADATNNAYQRIAAATDYVTTSTMGGYQFSPYLSFDGSDDSLLTNSVDFSATDKMTVWAGVTKLSDATFGVVVELSTAPSLNNGAFGVFAPWNNTEQNYGVSSRGTTVSAAFGAASGAGAIPAPNTSVLSMQTDIAAPVVSLKRNGAAYASNNSTQGTGNFGNYPLYIGSRNQASARLNGRLYQLIIRGAASTDDQINATETYVDQITRAY